MIAVNAIVTSSASRVLSESSSFVPSLLCDCFRQLAHESLRDDITQIRDCFFFLFLVCTFVVVIGVVLEEIKFRTGKSYVDAESGIFSPETSIALAKLGLWLVVLGIAGEALFETATSWTDGLLQDFNNTLLAITTTEAGNAGRSAEAAHKLGLELLGKYKAAEQEIIELKAEKLPRRLSSEQKAKLLRLVAAFQVKTISVGCVNGGKEAFDFEQDFVNAFSSPHSPVKLDSYMVSCGNILGAVNVPPIQIESGIERLSDADVLVSALVEIGIKKEQIATTHDTINRKLLDLSIGPKSP